MGVDEIGQIIGEVGVGVHGQMKISFEYDNLKGMKLSLILISRSINSGIFLDNMSKKLCL